MARVRARAVARVRTTAVASVGARTLTRVIASRVEQWLVYMPGQ